MGAKAEDGNMNQVECLPMSSWQHPPSFYCPISQQCMRDPVVLCDGHTYERRHIERWLRHHCTSPTTGAQLAQADVFPNHALRNAIEEYFQQVFSVHRRAIRKSIYGQGVNSSVACLRTIDSLMQCSLLVSADLSVECVLRQIMDEAKTLLGAEVASVFLVDAKAQELFSTVNSTGGELRIPVNAGIAGHVATSGELVVIKDAYTDERFNRDMDTKTGFRTRSMICAPLKTKKGKIIGVVQLINKIHAGCVATASFDGDALVDAATIDQNKEDTAGPTPPSFTADDVNFLRVFASQAVTAIANSEGLEPAPFAEPRDTGDTQGPCLRPSGLPSSSANTDDREVVLEKRTSAKCDADLEEQSHGHRPDDACHASASSCDRVHVMLDSPSDTSHAAKCAETPTGEHFSARAQKLLSEGFHSVQMDTLALADATGNRPLSCLGMFLFDRLELQDHIGYDRMKLSRFMSQIEKGYDEVRDNGIPYHNRAHAASVLHAMHALLHRTGFAKLAALAFKAESPRSTSGDGYLELMACLLAAIVHDYEHKGLSNDFLVKTSDDRASRYNDQHVNEHHHVAAALAVLQHPEHDFLECLSAAEYRYVRKLVIDLVLATDIANNDQIVSSFTTALDEAPAKRHTMQQVDGRSHLDVAFIPMNSREAILLLQMALKCSDLGHLALPWDLHVQWVHRLEAEFFAQGDREKELGLSVSFLMDRDKPGVAETQIGFFEFVVLPLFRAMCRAAPSAEHLLLAVTANCERWRTRASAYDEAQQSYVVEHDEVDELASERKKRSGRARQRMAKWKRSLRCRTPSPLSP